MLGNKPQHYAVVEALDSFKKAHISISNIFKVFDNLCAVKVSIDATLPCYCLSHWPSLSDVTANPG
jgi:hypothetical protein